MENNRARDRELVEAKLREFVPEPAVPQGELYRAMRYSLLAGGKRVRPLLVLEFCRACGGDTQPALPFACAVEMIHTYSLIHDDLPCMDNDDIRRGRPSNHKVFGEDSALLAGDALLTQAFETMLSPQSVAAAGAERACAAAHVLAEQAGAGGMVGGQVIDLMSEGKQVPLETLQIMDGCKTGALISAAAQMGCILGGGGEAELSAAREYASCVGLAFQIVDDILDVTATTEQLGKPAGSDKENKKSTYVSLLGLEKARALAQELTARACAALGLFGERGEYLCGFARSLVQRVN